MVIYNKLLIVYNTQHHVTSTTHILVTNFILGGSKGYSPDIKISTSNLPPSYGVPSGPGMVPIKCLQPGLPGMHLSSAAMVAMMPVVTSGLQMEVISLVMRASLGPPDMICGWWRAGWLELAWLMIVAVVFRYCSLMPTSI